MNSTTPTAQTAPEGAQITPLPSRLAYDRLFTGFNPAGYSDFKRGYDEAVKDLTASNAELRRALEELLQLTDAYRTALKMSDCAHMLAEVSPRIEQARAALGKEAK